MENTKMQTIGKQGIVNSFSSDLGNIRVIMQDNEPMFCLADIAKILEIQNPTDVANAIKREFELPRLNLGSFDTGYGVKEFSMVDESQLYFIIMRSNSKKSKPFRLWVTKEVLPSIRKNGGYIAGQESLSDDEFLARALVVANNVLRNKDKVIQEQKATITDQAQVINAYRITDKTRRNKQELVTLLNRKIRELADKEYNRQYNKAYLAVYEEFSKLHCFTHKIDMKFLRTNIDYLGECLKLVLDKLHSGDDALALKA